MTPEGLEIKLETLTDMLPLLHATQNPPLDLGTRSLIYDIGPWKGENLLAGIESFFQKNAYHPFATCGTRTVVKRDLYPYPQQLTIPTRNKPFLPAAWSNFATETRASRLTLRIFEAIDTTQETELS